MIKVSQQHFKKSAMKYRIFCYTHISIFTTNCIKDYAMVFRDSTYPCSSSPLIRFMRKVTIEVIGPCIDCSFIDSLFNISD